MAPSQPSLAGAGGKKHDRSRDEVTAARAGVCACVFKCLAMVLSAAYSYITQDLDLLIKSLTDIILTVIIIIGLAIDLYI